MGELIVGTNLRRLAALGLSLALALSLLAGAGPAAAAGTFDDVDGNVHEADIETIARLGITLGCNPPENDLYCPDDLVTRQQMASFLVRTFDLPPGPGGRFTDTAESVHARDIDALAASGITLGCNPPTNDRYCPTEVVTRGQMAAFMARGLGLEPSDDDSFIDDDGSIFEMQINAIAATGITRGCNPPTNDRYCPEDPVRRDQMASFLARTAAILDPGSTTTTTVPGSSTTTQPTTSTTFPVLPSVECDANTDLLDCLKTPIGYKPTSIEWYGDRLYVLAAPGTIHRYAVGADGVLGDAGSFDFLPSLTPGRTYTALGLAIEPGSSTTSPAIWITTSISGGPNYLQGEANSSTVWRIPSIETSTAATPMITGLPRSYENHAANSIHFHEGELYIAQGGNTGAGASNFDPDSAFGTRPEQPLSAAWLRADVLNGWNPATNGDCASDVSDTNPPTVDTTIPATCDVEILATGLRNMYDFVFHSNGNAYGPDNGLGVDGTVPDDECSFFVGPHTEDLDPGSQPDRFNQLVEGNYYGHPNPIRDECVFFGGSFQGMTPETNYVAGQVLTGGAGTPASLNSIIEYDSDGATATADWDGDFLMTAFSRGTGLFHYSLDETCATEQSAYSNGCMPRVANLTRPLGLELLPEGRLAVGEWMTRPTNEEQYLVILTPTS